MTASHFARAQMLLSQERYELAERELRQAISAAPDEPFGHAMLAICLGHQEKFAAAREEAQAAIGLGPDEDFCHYALALVSYQDDDLTTAEAAIRQAIELDPEDEDYHALLGWIFFRRKQWREALVQAELGLQINSEHQDCLNLRAMSQLQLGRKQEAAATIEGALARNPENALAHANQGWAYLHQGQPEKALHHFREALRLEPGLEFARAGLLESLKARYFVYRQLLRFQLWMSRLSGGAQWGVIIGMYLAVRILRTVGKENPALLPFTLPIVIAYGLFALISWIGEPVFNSLLRLNRFGRLALAPHERAASNGLLVLLALGAACGTMAVFPFLRYLWIAAAAYFLLLIIPVTHTLGRADPAQRRKLWLITAVLVLLGPAALVALVVQPPVAGFIAIAFVAGCVLFEWLAIAVALRRDYR